MPGKGARDTKTEHLGAPGLLGAQDSDGANNNNLPTG